MAFVETLKLRFDTTFVHSRSKLDDYVFSVDENFIAAKVHRSAIQCRHFQVELSWLKTFFSSHTGCSTSRRLDDHIRTDFLDGINQYAKAFAILGGGAVIKAGMQVNDCRT